MTFTDAAAQSKTFGTRVGRSGRRVRQARAVAAPGLAGHQAALPALGARARSGSPSPPAPWPSRMGGLYSKLFNLPLAEHLPYVTLGLIIWNLINASILEGADVFVANEGLIKQLPTPLSVHVYRLVWRQMILFGHNIIIFVVIAIIFPQPWKWTDLAVIPALALIVLNCVWVALCFGILATRYRDISPLLFSLVQLLFYMTPIIWNDQTLRDQGAGRLGQDHRVQPAAALRRHRARAAARRRPGAAALGGGARADHRRLDRHGVRDAAVPLARRLLGVEPRANGDYRTRNRDPRAVSSSRRSVLGLAARRLHPRRDVEPVPCVDGDGHAR